MLGIVEDDPPVRIRVASAELRGVYLDADALFLPLELCGIGYVSIGRRSVFIKKRTDRCFLALGLCLPLEPDRKSSPTT